MKTYLDCIPCFYSQALKTARISGANEEIQREILNELSKLIPTFPPETTPVEMGRKIYNLVNKMTGRKDPYREIKEESNKMALKLCLEQRERMNHSKDQLLFAIRLAIIGNLIDYGVHDKETIYSEIEDKLQAHLDPVSQKEGDCFEYASFCEHLKGVESVLYLADNAGEVAFDRILIEYLVHHCHKNVIYAVKGKPVLNDALVDDAISCGINEFANIISCGGDSPGIVLKRCSPEFVRIFNEAEMIISKGQGNYEALSESEDSIFFLLMAKCPVISRHIGCELGEFILKEGSNADSEE